MITYSFTAQGVKNIFFLGGRGWTRHKSKKAIFRQIRANNSVVSALILLKVYVLNNHWYIHNYVKFHKSLLHFWLAFDNENILTIKYPMLLIMIAKCILYVCRCMAHNKQSVSISICWPHTKVVRNWNWGEFTPPTLNILKNYYLFPSRHFSIFFDFPDMNLNMWNI